VLISVSVNVSLHCKTIDMGLLYCICALYSGLSLVLVLLPMGYVQADFTLVGYKFGWLIRV